MRWFSRIGVRACLAAPVIIRLVGALMLETNDERAVARRYMTLELARVTDTHTIKLPGVAA